MTYTEDDWLNHIKVEEIIRHEIGFPEYLLRVCAENSQIIMDMTDVLTVPPTIVQFRRFIELATTQFDQKLGQGDWVLRGSVK